jgi:hypothetical protein
VRSKLGKAVRDNFRKQLGERFPAFKEIRGAEVPPGWSLFGFEDAPDLAFFIVLAIFTKEDRFTIEGAWTRNGRFPAFVGLLFPRDLPDTNIRRDQDRNGDFRFRLGYLWQPEDYTWDLVPRISWEQSIREQNEFLETGTIPPEPSLTEAMGKVDPMVKDAIDKIEQHLLAYFDQIAVESSHGANVSELAKRR